MKYEFSAKGHHNITAAHRTTLEFTKDAELTKKGDCIIGVDSDFDAEELKKLLKAEKIRMTITASGLTERITAVPNPGFDSNHEMVIRKTDFISTRTFAIRADKASADLGRDFAERLMKNSLIKMSIESS